MRHITNSSASPKVRLGTLNELQSTLQNFTTHLAKPSNSRSRLRSRFKITAPQSISSYQAHGATSSTTNKKAVNLIANFVTQKLAQDKIAKALPL